MKTARLLIISVLAFCASCAEEPTTVPRIIQTSVVPNGNSGGPAIAKHLPYGLAIPRDVEPDGIPEPFNPAKHGRPVPNTLPEENLARLPWVPHDRGHRRSEFDLNHEAPPGTGDRGLGIMQYDSTTGGLVSGIYAQNDAQRDFYLPDPSSGEVRAYAPTHLSANGPCLETTTMHKRDHGAQTIADFHGFWNWCIQGPVGDGDWATLENMDRDNWLSRYVRIYNGEERYFTQVYQDHPLVPGPADDGWHGLLYNFNLGMWEEKAYSYGTNIRGWTNGWSIWESYWLMPTYGCPTIKSVHVSYLQAQVNGQWQYLNQHTAFMGTIGGSCWINGTYTFNVNMVNYDWTAYTPSP